MHTLSYFRLNTLTKVDASLDAHLSERVLDQDLLDTI